MGIADITILILNDHDWFREQFAKLDELQAQSPVNQHALTRVWGPLADKLDVHALIEEKIFYPQLLKRGGDDAEGETLDAIGDHDDIRDGVRDANAAALATDEWWAAVGRTRVANDDHMVEEEREGLADFRRHAPIGCVSRSERSTASSWPSTRPLAAFRSPTTTRRATSTSNRPARDRCAPITHSASAASKASSTRRTCLIVGTTARQRRATDRICLCHNPFEL